MKSKQKAKPVAAVCQLRSGEVHPFGALRAFTPLGTGEERMYRELREAVPVLDAAVVKLVRLAGGFHVKCRNTEAEQKLQVFLREVPCGRGQYGVESFLSGYLDSLLTYGRAVGEMVVAGGKLQAVCWGDVTRLVVQEGSNPLETVIYGPNEQGRMAALPYQQLLLLTTWNPEPAHPYGVSMFRGMPFLAEILLKIYKTIGTNWERAGKSQGGRKKRHGSGFFGGWRCGDQSHWRRGSDFGLPSTRPTDHGTVGGKNRITSIFAGVELEHHGTDECSAGRHPYRGTVGAAADGGTGIAADMQNLFGPGRSGRPGRDLLGRNQPAGHDGASQGGIVSGTS